MTTPFRGIYPILYAFFGPDGRLDEAAMRRQVRWVAVVRSASSGP